MKPFVRSTAGFTLIELIASLGIFAVIAGMMYGMFIAVQKQVASTSANNALAEKGQRILTYMEEDIRMIGFLLGPDARVPYCTGGTTPDNPNIIVHNGRTFNDPNGNTNTATPYDTFQFLTSQPVMITETDTCFSAQKDASGNARKDYFLTSVGLTSAGLTVLNVDASTSCYDDIAVGSATDNGRSLVTFESLFPAAAPIAASGPQVFYQTQKLDGTQLTLTSSLQQDIPDNSTVYTVRQYRYSVDTTGGARDLIRTGCDKSCGADTSRLVETSNSASTAGGVDGFKIEFTFLDIISNTLITQSSLPPLAQLKSVTVWLLLRSDRIDPTYTDTATYILGSTNDKITLGPFKDAASHYRRMLLNKTVEVKNLVSIY